MVVQIVQHSQEKSCHSLFQDDTASQDDLGNKLDPRNGKDTTTNDSEPLPEEEWYYPADIAHDLDGIDVPHNVKGEVLACAWEYTRCVIPQYTNWDRYVAFMRTIIIGIIVEFRGNMVDVSAGDDMLGYDLQAVLDSLFKGTVGHEAMSQEFRSFLLITSEKASERRHEEIFRRYVNALSKSPRQWFRMRDSDALVRFTIASALVCNDLDNVMFTDKQFEVLAEIGNTLYDAVAFFKHRSEGETNSTFAYMPPRIRVKAFHQSREVLWALDVALAGKVEHQAVINFLRFFGGPIHMMMRRYRFVDDGLVIGKPETDDVITQTRQNFKLWNRVDAQGGGKRSHGKRYLAVMAQSKRLMYDEMPEYLEKSEVDRCPRCRYRESYGAETRHAFGGVELCDTCREGWASFQASVGVRAIEAFPELALVLKSD